jgi:hypothetical protein
MSVPGTVWQYGHVAGIWAAGLVTANSTDGTPIQPRPTPSGPFCYWGHGRARASDLVRFDLIARCKQRLREQRGRPRLGIQCCRRRERHDRAHGVAVSQPCLPKQLQRLEVRMRINGGFELGDRTRQVSGRHLRATSFVRLARDIFQLTHDVPTVGRELRVATLSPCARSGRHTAPIRRSPLASG